MSLLIEAEYIVPIDQGRQHWGKEEGINGFLSGSDGDGYEELDHSVKEPSQKERILFIALEKKIRYIYRLC